MNSIIASLLVAIAVMSFLLNQSYGAIYSKYSLNDYDRIIQYCFDHANEILLGKNPVMDLRNASLIPEWFDGRSCFDVQTERDELNVFLGN